MKLVLHGNYYSFSYSSFALDINKVAYELLILLMIMKAKVQEIMYRFFCKKIHNMTMDMHSSLKFKSLEIVDDFAWYKKEKHCLLHQSKMSLQKLMCNKRFIYNHSLYF